MLPAKPPGQSQVPTDNRPAREQRYSIKIMNDRGYGPTAIAQTIGVPPSTASSELGCHLREVFPSDFGGCVFENRCRRV
jgi:hypothetical protein